MVMLRLEKSALGGTDEKGNTNRPLIDTNCVPCRSIRAVAQPSGGCLSLPMILVD